MPTVAEVIKHLEDNYSMDEHIAAPIWCKEDVLGVSYGMGKNITRAQAQQILDHMDSHHDCELGITWDTVRSEIEDASKE